MTTSAEPAIDLRRAALPEVRALDLRSARRSFADDEMAIHDRLVAASAGLDEAAWQLPGAAPSDAGGPDWSLAEHVGHLVVWQELAIDYVAVATATGRWPADADFDGGDFDAFNERHRMPWARMPSDAILDRFAASRSRLLAATAALPDDVLRGDDAWTWIFLTLHGHYLDHLAILEPWTSALRARQADGDPFVDDPRAADHAALRAADAILEARFRSVIDRVPFGRWDAGEVTPGWTLRDHVGHLADWAAEGARAIDVFERRGHWLADPEEGIDAWNEHRVADARGESPAATLARYEACRADLLAAIGRLSVDDLRSPDGWSWAYDCLHGHTRKHLALIGPWSARLDWPVST